jgi:hypothetical protein
MDWPEVLTALLVLFVIIWFLKTLGGLLSQKVFWSSKLQDTQQQFIDSYILPSSIGHKVLEIYPHLSAGQEGLVLKGLREFFQICQQAGTRFVSMPSQVVDVAWHQFILSTRSYEDFCQNAFGRFLHHTPAEALKKKSKGKQGIKIAWRLACGREGINPKNPERLPLLFALDADLAIPNGFKYSLDCRKPGSHPYCAGHIGCGGDGGTGGSDTSDSSSPGDSSGDSGGSSCGSSCGGGCGGD